MTENIPPGSASKAAAVSADRPGLPYYEKLRRDLRDTLQKKRLLDRNLAAIEDQIYRQETGYLEETSAAGNIVKGFDNYIKASAVSASANTAGGNTISGSAAGGSSGSGVGGGSNARRKAPVNDSDRIFSKSSVSFSRGGDNTDTPSSAVSTPAAAGGAGGVGTPTGSFAAENSNTGGHGHGHSNGNNNNNNNNSGNNNNKKKKKSVGGGGTSTGAGGAANHTNTTTNANDDESDSRATKRQKISFGRKGHDD